MFSRTRLYFVLGTGSCAAAWILGTYPVMDEAGVSFFVRVGAYFVVVALFGFLVVEYILHQKAVTITKQKDQ